MSIGAPTKDYRTGRVVGLATTAALGGFLFGYDSAVINGAASALKSLFGLSDIALGFVVSIALIGSAIGAWFAGGLADRLVGAASCWWPPRSSSSRPSARRSPSVSST
jgi:MFS family permease